MNFEPLAHVNVGRGANDTRRHWAATWTRYQLLLWRKWWVWAAFAMAGMLAGWMHAWLEKPSYISVGRMIVSIKLSIPEGTGYTEELSNFLGTQVALMQSDLVRQRALGRVAARDTNQLLVSAALRVNVLPKTTIFVLEAASDDARFPQAFLQACMEEYIVVKREMRAQTSDSTLAGLTEELLRLDRERRRAEEEISAFQGTNQTEVFQEINRGPAGYLESLHQRHAAWKSDLTLLAAVSPENAASPTPDSSFKSIANDLGSRAGPIDHIDPEYQKSKQQLLLLKAEHLDLGQSLRPKHPKMIAMREEIARRERQLEIIREQNAEQLENRRQALSLQIENLEKEIAGWESKVMEIRRKSGDYQRLKANAQRIQILYDRLLATMQTLDLNKQVNPESVSIMEPASTPMPDHSAGPRQALIGVQAGAVLGLLCLLLLDRLDDRVKSLSELQETFDEEILGVIPLQKIAPGTLHAGLIQTLDSRHAFVEAYRNLRSGLLFSHRQTSCPKTIAITSSVPGEGKSLTATNLAITLANAGSRVLLVDADLRKGALHQALGGPADPGLCEVLGREEDWAALVRTPPGRNFCFLPRGAHAQYSEERFVTATVERFLSAATRQYDFVLLDSAPVLAVADVTSLAPQVDAVLFVIRAEHTSSRMARAALDLLHQRRGKVLGLIFNAVRASCAGYPASEVNHAYWDAAESSQATEAKL